MFPFATNSFYGVNRIQVRPLREGVTSVVHDGVIIVGKSKRVHLLARQLVEIVLLAWIEVQNAIICKKTQCCDATISRDDSHTP